MRPLNLRDGGLIAGWLLAVGLAGLVAWSFLETPLTDPLGSAAGLARVLRALFVVLLVLVLTALLFVGLRRAQRGDEESRLLLSLASGTLLLVDAGGIIRYANPSMSAMFGLASHEVEGRPVQQLLAPESVVSVRALLAGASPDGSPAVRLVGRRNDGSTLPLEASVRRARVQGAKVFGLHLRDVTERDELVRELADRAAQLARSNRDLEQFAYVASHDLQEPLRMVGSYTQLLQQRYRGKMLDADAEEFLGYAEEGAARMREMIDNLLAYSRLGSRGKPFERLSMEQAFAIALRNLRGPIGSTGAEVTHGPLPEVEGDASQLVQLLQNLIENAIKFRGPSKPEIRVTAEQEGSEWVFSLKDNGIGIAPEHQDRIFVLFQRLHSREEYPGSGIGLSTCKKVVERHGGRIWVTSSGKAGEGSEFHFTLPTHQTAGTAVVKPATPTPASPRAEQARTLIEQRLAELI